MILENARVETGSVCKKGGMPDMITQEMIMQKLEAIQEMLMQHERLFKDAAKVGGDPCLNPRAGPCPHQAQLQEILLDAIQVLEDSRKHFKSKALEMLRRKMLAVMRAQIGNLDAHVESSGG